MSNLVLSQSVPQVKEWNGQRVVTFRDIDDAHNKPRGTARRNFTHNKKFFVENEDYFVIRSQSAENTANSSMYDFRTLGVSKIPPKGLTVFTETGYLLLVKSFTDELSWKVQRQLVSTYFKAKELAEDNAMLENATNLLMITRIGLCSGGFAYNDNTMDGALFALETLFRDTSRKIDKHSHRLFHAKED